jgi:hypothetical protein
MSVENLIRSLDYEGSPNFLEGEALAEVDGCAYLFRRAQKTCKLRGVYVLREGAAGSTTIPLVYVCEARDEEGAHLVHRRVWNQNIVPFVLVQTPKVVRLYSGFRYDGPPPEATLLTPSESILRVVTDFNRIAAELAGFRSEAIDQGVVWREWERQVDPRARVDWRLLDQLSRLGSWLRENGLARGIAHALIGKYVFLRYLRDREILSDRKFEDWGIDPQTVFSREATLGGLERLITRLDDWLNGSIFPLCLEGEAAPSLKHLRRVAGAFNGDDPIHGQRHLDFQPYDFSHLPVETLSVIYEQFLHAEGKGHETGAYYTPVPLVDFVLQELEDRSPLVPGRRVFDASCGSGAFLVQCYRRIVERRVRENAGIRPRPGELRDLLVRHVCGMDMDEDACRVAELSLVLTMLDYIEPPDLRRTPTFKIPALHNVNIFHHDFFAVDCPLPVSSEEGKFDWVVGNPPWRKAKTDSSISSDRTALTWMRDNASECPVGGHQVAEAFAWKLAKHLTEDGVAGILLPAMTLFQDNSVRFRKRFFEQLNVWCVANFSNLTEVLFAGRSRVPAAAFFYSLRDEEEEHEEILTYSPFVANQEANRPNDLDRRKDTWNLVVNASEVRSIPAAEAARGDQLTWKVAMWGSQRDRRLLASLAGKFPTLNHFAKTHHLTVSVGVQLRSAGEGNELVEEFIGKNVLNTEALRNLGIIFSFPETAFNTIPRARAYLRTRGGRGGVAVAHPPHVIVDETRRFAVYTDQYLVIRNPAIGIAGRKGQERLLKALSLILISDYATYYQFFTSPGWGVKREQATLRALQGLPIPLGDVREQSLSAWESLHDKLVAAPSGTLFDGPERDRKHGQRLRDRLNELVYKAIGVDSQDRYLVEDLVRVRLSMDEGKLSAEAMDPALPDMLKEYAQTLKEELDTFTEGEDGVFHAMRVEYDDQSGVVLIDLADGPMAPVTVDQARAGTASAFEQARRHLRRKHSQWLYFDRNLIVFDGERTLLFKPRQRLHWTRSQALLDADQVIAETLANSED